MMVSWAEEPELFVPALLPKQVKTGSINDVFPVLSPNERDNTPLLWLDGSLSPARLEFAPSRLSERGNRGSELFSK